MEEGRPKRPWVQIAPVYPLFASNGDRTRIRQGRGFDYLVPITALVPPDGALWVGDLRLFVVAEKGWLVGREMLAAFADEAGYDRLGQQLGRRFARTAYATVIVEHILRPAHELFSGIIERYEGRDPIVEVGLALGRSRLQPVNAQLVFMLDGELSSELRAQIVEWWQPLSEAARADGLELLAPRFVSLDDLTAREYRELDVLDASSLSPEPEQLPTHPELRSRANSTSCAAGYFSCRTHDDLTIHASRRRVDLTCDQPGTNQPDLAHLQGGL